MYSNYLEPPKENVLGEYDAVTLLMLYMKVLMIWFRKISKLIFQMQPSCPRNIYILNIEENYLASLSAFLETFLYIKNNGSVEHV